jgi:hypothetical protein
LPTTKQHFYIHREEERVKKVKGGVDWACTWATSRDMDFYILKKFFVKIEENFVRKSFKKFPLNFLTAFSFIFSLSHFIIIINFYINLILRIFSIQKDFYSANERSKQWVKTFESF